MAHTAFLNSIHHVAEAVNPYLSIHDEDTYKAALDHISALMEEAQDNEADRFTHTIIHALSNAVEEYENQRPDIQQFVNQANDIPADLAMLRTLMSQYNLTGSDLPEIGDKSLVSRILRGERKLSKTHIEKLSERFNINPSLFF